MVSCSPVFSHPEILHRRQGTYLLLERCKTVCYRNLFKRIHLILGTHIIPLENNGIITALNWMDIHIDFDEVECILANLIFKGIIRGYIHHNRRLLVLSKRDPFPPVSMLGK
jgi:nuclear mRNA export protein PCID2/THP1